MTSRFEISFRFQNKGPSPFLDDLSKVSEPISLDGEQGINKKILKRIKRTLENESVL